MKNVQMNKIKDIFFELRSHSYPVLCCSAIPKIRFRKFPNEGTFGSSVYLFYFGHKPKPCGGYFRRIVSGTCGLYVRRSLLLRQLFHAFKGKLLPPYAYFLYRPVHWCYFSRILRLLIGTPVLRLKGDYLAIVTLAFGEIIKNINNALYFGVDKNGWHFSLRTVPPLLWERGKWIIKRRTGELPVRRNIVILL